MMICKLFVCFHKNDVVFENKYYVPIHVGKQQSAVELGFVGDDTGDTISNKNPWYSELTAQYWIWKNVKDIDYVGLCHYRRFLDFKSSFTEKFRTYIHADEKYVPNHINIPLDMIEKYDIVLPKLRVQAIPIYESLCIAHIRSDVNILGNVVKELYPSYYSDYEDVILNGNKYSPCNMIIAKKNIFNDYSKWLFDILFEFEKRLTIPMNPYQPRFAGYYSERLLLVFVHHHSEYKIKYLPMIIIDENKNKPLLLGLFRDFLRNITFRLYRIQIDKRR